MGQVIFTDMSNPEVLRIYKQNSGKVWLPNSFKDNNFSDSAVKYYKNQADNLANPQDYRLYSMARNTR